MDWTRTLIVCLGCGLCFVLVSSQSPSAMYVISGPEVLHAGTSTSLAVTVLTNTGGTVTAELAHGDIRVTQTAGYDGGVTKVLTLPAINGSLPHNSLFTLTVTGHRGSSVVFTDTISLRYNLRNVSTLIQTDRLHYRPGDTVRARVVSVQLDNLPFNGKVKVSVQDRSGNIVDWWESTGNLGIVLQEFSLSQTALLGQWTITTTIHGVTDEKKFTVDHAERPHFDVIISTKPQILVDEDLTGSVRAFYPSGQPVGGTLTISVRLAPDKDMDRAALANELTQSKEIYGSTQFSFSKDQLQTLLASSGVSGEVRVLVAASVISSFVGSDEKRTVEVRLFQNTYQLRFHDYPPSIKPSLNFSTKLMISRYNGEPLSSRDLTETVLLEVTQLKSTEIADTETLTFPVPQDGDVHVNIKLQDLVEILFIRALFKSSEETLRVYNDIVSPSNSYIHIAPIASLPAQVGSSFHVNVESSFKLTSLHFVVSSKGRVLDAGTRNSSSFSLTPTLSWYPEACVTVYHVLPDGEVTSDKRHVPVKQPHDISLSWSSPQAQPGQQVSLTVSALEPGSRLGIVVIGMHNDSAPVAGRDAADAQDCCVWLLTNATRHRQMQCDGSESDGVQLMEKSWSHWLDTTASLLWSDRTVSEHTWTTGDVNVPDTVDSLGAVALIMSASLGLSFTPVPIKLPVLKDFTLSLNVPSYLIRGEEIVLEINVINHLEMELTVIVLLAQSAAFEFVLAKEGDVSVTNAQKLTIGGHTTAVARFPIRPVALGEMEISVDAVCAESSDSLVQIVFVKPEGVEQTFTQTLFLELALKKNYSDSISFSFPPDVIPGSQRTYVALSGDLLGLSIDNMDSLTPMPVGCGEQNLIHFTPSVYVLDYLEMMDVNKDGIRQKAMERLMEGYQRQLLYQRDDGSFSAFRDRDALGNTWLTAYVLQSFLQAESYIQINHSVLSRATAWLINQQGADGKFREVGRVINTELQEALDKDSVALTAYVLITLLKNQTYKEMYSDNVDKAQTYLESKVTVGVVSNYSLALVAYALALANNPVAGTVLDELMDRADKIDGIMMWGTSAGLRSHGWQPYSAQIEMTSYILLAFSLRGDFEQVFDPLKWLCKQRNYLGGYVSTQDTVVALEALSFYAAFSGASAIDLRLNVSVPALSLQSPFTINFNNYLKYQTLELDGYDGSPININFEGRGFGLFQMNVFYNVESAALSQNLKPTADDTFSLTLDVSEEGDHDHLLLYICMSLKEHQVISQTGMVILDVGLLSGFTAVSPAAAATTDLIRKVETFPEKIYLYLASLNKSEVCISLRFIKIYKVSRIQDAVVQLYDYYEPQRKAVRTYNSDFFHNMDSCFYCGPNCDDCRPGISISVSPSIFSRSGNAATYSLIGIILGVTVFLLT